MSKVNIAVIGGHAVGKHSIIDRQIGLANGPDYLRWFDPLGDNSEIDQHLYVGGEGVDVKWHPLSIKELPRSPAVNSGSGPPRLQDLPPRYALGERESLEQEVEREVQWGRQLMRDNDACVLVYCCTDRRSFEHLKWIWNELYVAQERSSPDVPFCKHVWVIANKIDWPDPEVSSPEGYEFSNQIGATFRQMSARTGESTEGLDVEVTTCVLTARSRTDTRINPREEISTARGPREHNGRSCCAVS